MPTLQSPEACPPLLTVQLSCSPRCLASSPPDPCCDISLLARLWAIALTLRGYCVTRPLPPCGVGLPALPPPSPSWWPLPGKGTNVAYCGGREVPLLPLRKSSGPASAESFATAQAVLYWRLPMVCSLLTSYSLSTASISASSIWSQLCWRQTLDGVPSGCEQLSVIDLGYPSSSFWQAYLSMRLGVP